MQVDSTVELVLLEVLNSINRLHRIAENNWHPVNRAVNFIKYRRTA